MWPKTCNRITVPAVHVRHTVKPATRRHTA